MPHVRNLGAKAEDQVAQYLLDLGYVIVGRRVRVGALEIDVVAIDHDVLVFVEVKLSRVAAIPASDNLTHQKLNRLEEAARAYLLANDWGERPVRFDFVIIDCGHLVHHIGALAGP